MKLTPRELDSLLIHQAGFLAQKRLARGCKLNHPETVALIACQIQEFARNGDTVAELMSKGHYLLGRKQVMKGVQDLVREVQVEATFPDGTKLVTVSNPICREHGDLELALYGSFIPIPEKEVFEVEDVESNEDVKLNGSSPGCVYVKKDKDIPLNVGRGRVKINVSSICDRPIQVGSHYHFIETNRQLVFDRAMAYGMRLDIPAGCSVRFEPGEIKQVTLVEIAGKKIIRGGNNLCDGQVGENHLPAVMERVIKKGFGHKEEPEHLEPVPCKISRYLYARLYGPTVGDKVRLGDTCLVVEVEKDFAVYGDECKFGGGKVIRDGMGQASKVCNKATLDTLITNCLIVDALQGIVKADVGIKVIRDGMGQASKVSNKVTLDTLITNCLIVDAIQGIVKADVGIKGNLIAGIGKAGNPDIMNNVSDGMIIGVNTDVISGEGMILTAGGIDSHVHFICPQLVRTAIASGVTTLIGGGIGPSTGTRATTCTPAPSHIKFMIESTDAFPMNFGFTGKGNTSDTKWLSSGLTQQVEAGAIGLKLHEDWGSTPAAIDCCLSVADAYDIQVLIHTDTLNESSCVEDSIAAFKGRTIHTYHTEGAGGGHAPDIIKVCSEWNCIPSSTNPTRPFTRNTMDEHLDMMMVCHHLDKDCREDLAFVESRIRAETIAAEDILHDMGAISIMTSDSQAMGRISEVICRTWQTADKMKKTRGCLPEDSSENDNFRVKRYVAKYTINPAIAHGVSHLIGSVEVGKMADLVLWQPGFFGVKPSMIIKGGFIAWSEMGLSNASIPTVEPVNYRKMFGSYGKCVSSNSCIFVSKLAHEKGTVKNYGIGKKIEAVKNCRNISKKSMIHNDALPKLKVDPETYKVYVAENVNGKEEWTHLTCEPATRLPLAGKYFLF